MERALVDAGSWMGDRRGWGCSATLQHLKKASQAPLGGRGAVGAWKASALIIFTRSDTEIDFSTYMQQVEQFLGGERNYGLIKGDTGPVV